MQNASKLISSLAGAFLLLFVAVTGFGQGKNIKPNVVVILVDDMGYSDLGCYGGEIQTPNIDKLAAKGTRFKEFYNTGRCCPTRATLLTGQYPHMTGLGHMTGFDQKEPGYRGELNDQCVTIAETLKPTTYSSYMSGKWHVCTNAEDEKGDIHNWPLQRGFDRFFGILNSAANYFEPEHLFSDNKRVKPGKDFYLTDAISDTASMYINQHVAKKKNDPFFMYVAYNAPHWPIHAKEQDIQKYMDKYSMGWDELREQRFARQKKMGLLDASVKLSERDARIPAWKDIPEADRPLWTKRMAVYAASIDAIDQGVGRIVETLKKNKVHDNTLIVFMSDNGGCPEHVSRKSKAVADLGSVKSFESYWEHWANVSNTPFRRYKSHVHEGGIITPFIVQWPGKINKPGGYVNSPAHLIDLYPTLLAVTGANYPKVYNGQQIHPLPGRNMQPLLSGGKLPEDRPVFWEHQANKAVRVGNWKLVSQSKLKEPYEGPWELYDLSKDKIESENLAAKYPDKVKEMEKLWNDWATANNVFPLIGTDVGGRKKQFGRTLVK